MKTLKACLLFILLCRSFFIDAQVTFQPVTGSPFSTGSGPSSVAFSPDVSGNVFAAVANSGDNNVSVYSVDTMTGVFTPVSGSPFPVGSTPYSVAFSPDVSGNVFAAVANNLDNDVSVYSVNTTTGLFTPVSGSPFSAGSAPYSVAFSPDVSGNVFAAVANSGDNNVSVYSVDTMTGVFTPVSGSPFPVGSTPFSVAFSPDVSGNVFAAVANTVDSNVSVYSVNTTTGAFTQVSGSPFSTGSGPYSVAFSPDIAGNLFAAVANSGDNNVSVYSVNTTTGAFTQVPGSPFPGDFLFGAAISVAFSPNVAGSLFAAVANTDGIIYIYSVNTMTGVFTQVSGSPFSANGLPSSVAFSPDVAGNLFVASVSDSNAVTVYQLLSPPTINGVSPNTGPFSGGTSVTISGTNFTQSTTVNFGGTPSPSVTFVSSTELIAISPVGSGTVDVTVTTAAGTSAISPADQFTYFFPPTVTGVSPNTGPFSGGTSVTISGTNFTPSTTVKFGNTPSSSVTFVSSTELIAISPAGSGTVDVTVTTAAGTSTISPADQFTYLFPPTVTGVSPNTGPFSGGTSVTISGTNFTPSATVNFGGAPSPSVTFVSSTELIAISPAGSGTVDVTVTTAAGTSTISPADQFTYLFPPTVTGVSPNTGPFSGGTSVTISGTNFTPSTTVKFGNTPSSSVTFVSSTELIAISPPGSGTVDVTVTTAGSTSTTSSADQFTYVPLPPRHLVGFQKINKFATQIDIVNILTWKPPLQGSSSIVAYKIFRNKQLTELLAVIPSHETLKFKDHNRKKGKTYHYYIVSVDQFGNMSAPSKVKVPSIKEKDL